MKKTVCFFSACIITASSLFAATNNNISQKKGNVPVGQAQQGGQMKSQAPDCSKLTPEEQNFSYQLMNANNKMMFCNQFTSEQRQDAMQMMGQTTSSGAMMTADQAVQQVMQDNGMMPMGMQKGKAAGGACPVK